MAKNSDMTQMLGLMIIVIIALALTPTVASAVGSAGYVAQTDYKVIVPATSNSTSALTYTARNDSSTYAYFTIVANDTLNEGLAGLLTVDCSKNITYTVSTGIVLFKTGVFVKATPYNMSITYYYQSLDAAEISLLAIVPLLWVVMILSAVVVFVVYKLKFH